MKLIVKRESGYVSIRKQDGSLCAIYFLGGKTIGYGTNNFMKFKNLKKAVQYFESNCP